MPKLPMDYSKTIIYKIEHIDDDSLVYVGHTTNWDKRKCKHKFNCYAEKSGHYNLKLYQMIRENGGWEKFRMIEIEKYPCNNRRDADKRETGATQAETKERKRAWNYCLACALRSLEPGHRVF